ncbi:hypothetical protein [Natribacillus halophilus]|uniref:DUF4129 domain-containing protein n=1 Tax=Natribacillus halophilus TaxID=549003 RepID=A0A1G8QG75_9BACI|nr:hypothetical protein [Natribacillus halophilus]SDJ03774.1 hypothetical protein SAMN04488123_11222 [Natribacillus halophilus]
METRNALHVFYMGIDINLILGITYLFYAFSDLTFSILPMIGFVFIVSLVTVLIRQRITMGAAYVLLAFLGVFLFNLDLVWMGIVLLLTPWRVQASRPFTPEDLSTGRFLVYISLWLLITWGYDTFSAGETFSGQLFLYLVLMIVGVILYVIGTYVTKKETYTRPLPWVSGWFGMLGAVILVLLMVLPLFESLFQAATERAAQFISYLVAPIFYGLEWLISVLASDTEDPASEPGEEGMENELEELLQGGGEPADIQWIGTVVILLLFIAAAIFIFKKMRNLPNDQGDHSTSPIIFSKKIKQPERASRKIEYSSAYGNQVRQAVTRLEAFAGQRGYGRDGGETLPDWLDRITDNMSAVQKEAYLQCYECTRYGNELIDHDDAEWFITETEQIKDHLDRDVDNSSV